MKYIIESERVGLRAWIETDLSFFIEMNQDSDVMQYFPKCFTTEETKASVVRYSKHLEENGFGFLAAELKDSGEFIGFVGMQRISYDAFFTPSVEIGWRLRKKYWRQGYASETALACLDYAFGKLMLEDIHSITTLSNMPSEMVMKKIGMKKIGTFQHPLIDKDHDMSEHLVYHLSKDDFLTSN